MAASSNLSTLEATNAIESLTVEKTRALVFRLGVPVNILDDIETQYNGDNRKQHFIQKWLEIDTSASWGKIVSALQQINMNVLAAGIETMYITKAIVPVPTSAPTTASKPSLSVNTPAQMEAAPLPVTPTPATVKPPTVHLIQFTAVSKERVAKVQKTIKHFEYEFSDIKSDVRVSLSKRESQDAEFIGKFRDHLLDLPVSKRPIHSKFFRENEDEILEASHIPKLFAILGRYCNYSNYDIILIVVERFCETSLKTRMSSYRDSLEKFEMATTVDVYLCAISAHPEGEIWSQFSRMVLKINKPASECTLYQVRQLKELIMERASLHSYSAYIVSTGEGSVSVGLCFPRGCGWWVACVVTPEFRKTHYLTEVTIDGYDITSHEFMVKNCYRSEMGTNQSKRPGHDIGKGPFAELQTYLMHDCHVSGPGRGRERGRRGRGDCRTYKFLRECEKHNRGECPYRHERVARNTFQECVRIPPGMTTGRIVGAKGCNLKELSSIAQCHIDVGSQKVTIITDDQAKLPLLTNKMKLIMSQNCHVSGPSWCYIHPLGVSSHGVYSFKPYRGRLPPAVAPHSDVVYELCRDLQQKELDSACADSDIVTKLAEMSPSIPDDTSDGLRNTLQSVLHGATPGSGRTEGKSSTRKIQIHLNPRLNIKRALNDSLKILCENRQQNNIVTRLDARFGKVTWRRLTEHMYTRKHDIEKLAELLFADDAKHKNIFTTDVRVVKAEGVRPELARLSSSHLPLETFDVKVTSIGSGRNEEEGTRLDVRLQVKRKEDMETDLQVLLVKKDEIRDVTFDIVNLHRQHDVRIDLRHYECVTEGETDHAVVREMISRITYPSRHVVRIQPKTSRWNVHLIRHKKKMTYILDESFAITIATVSEHSFDVQKDEAVTFDMREEGHAEVELHNLPWECAFGRDAGFSSNQALALHIERGSVDTRDYDTIPHPWHADSILRDFERFWDHLETLSEKLDGV